MSLGSDISYVLVKKYFGGFLLNVSNYTGFFSFKSIRMWTKEYVVKRGVRPEPLILVSVGAE